MCKMCNLEQFYNSQVIKNITLVRIHSICSLDNDGMNEPFGDIDIKQLFFAVWNVFFSLIFFLQ